MHHSLRRAGAEDGERLLMLPLLLPAAVLPTGTYMANKSTKRRLCSDVCVSFKRVCRHIYLVPELEHGVHQHQRLHVQPAL